MGVDTGNTDATPVICGEDGPCGVATPGISAGSVTETLDRAENDGNRFERVKTS